MSLSGAFLNVFAGAMSVAGLLGAIATNNLVLTLALAALFPTCLILAVDEWHEYVQWEREFF